MGYPGFELAVDERVALDGVTVLFGPSGGGKSTLLRTIAGLEQPRRGRVAIGDEVWFDEARGIDLAAHHRPAGLMFQDARLFTHLDVAGNLDFAETRSRKRGTQPARREVVDALDLGPLLNRRVDGLSGGERQRVALGRTLLSRPRLLMLDEPLAALDHERKQEILPYLERLPERFGLPAIYVSHSIEEVVRLAGRVLLLADGRVQAHGDPSEILQRLDLDSWTGRFGASSLIDGRLDGHDERLGLSRIALDDASLVDETPGGQHQGDQHLVVPRVQGPAVGDPVRVRILARDVVIALERPRGISIRNVLPARVAAVEPEEGSAFTSVSLSVGGKTIRARLTRASAEELELQPGADVFALIKTAGLDSD
ncbi:hypothetical protein ABI59_15350 [Acidobacteria bacterium Mor1]|nr:hypothetical protein ABI59_15350 [Acidobacteria bacterium Mor1]